MASNELDSYIFGLKKTSSASTSAGANPKQEEGQYFVDPNTGQYYFQSGNGEAMSIVLSDEAEANTNPTNSGPSTSDNQVNNGFVILGHICKLLFFFVKKNLFRNLVSVAHLLQYK